MRYRRSDRSALEEIVVTATRREENLQDVPIAVTVVTGAAIQEGGFADVEDLAAFLPNVTIQDGFQGQSLTVRGIGTDPRNEAFEQAVAQFSDGVYYGRENLVLSRTLRSSSASRSCASRSPRSPGRARRPVR